MAGVLCDGREPNVIRIAPTPLYNTFEEVWRFVEVFEKAVREEMDSLKAETEVKEVNAVTATANGVQAH